MVACDLVGVVDVEVVVLDLLVVHLDVVDRAEDAVRVKGLVVGHESLQRGQCDALGCDGHGAVGLVDLLQVGDLEAHAVSGAKVGQLLIELRLDLLLEEVDDLLALEVVVRRAVGRRDARDIR